VTALSDLALEKAQDVLKRECSPLGLMASPEGYPHVWARDSVITGLGASLTPGHEDCLRTSLHTLAGQQFMDYQKFGPEGRDGKKGTEDDLADPLKAALDELKGRKAN